MSSVFIGVDVGGTKTSIGAVTLPKGDVLERIDLVTPAREIAGAGFLDEVVQQAAALAARTSAPAVGVSLCELVAPDGSIGSGHRVDWQGLDVAAAFGGLRAVVEADVRAAALAEARLGAGTGYRDLLYVNLGTGISSCWLRDGVPHAGARGNALLLASSPIETLCPQCGTRHAYVLEETAGAAGLLARYRHSGREARDTQDLFARARNGDAGASAVLATASEALGVSIGLALNILDPGALVLGGGLAQAGGAYGSPLEEHIRSHVWAPATRALPIFRAALGAGSAMIGAALCAADRFGPRCADAPGGRG